MSQPKLELVRKNEATCPQAKSFLRFVLDTNVVLDMLWFDDARTRNLLRAIQARRCECFTTLDCLDELARVCHYPKLKLPPAERQNLMARYRALATVFDPSSVTSVTTAALPVCRDPDDQKFLILAATCGADHLVTRDQALLELADLTKKLPHKFINDQEKLSFAIVSLENLDLPELVKP